jgi:ABC-type branched-subunit amino acid transport system substrate-binding protein
LYIADSRDDPRAAAAAVSDLVAQHKVMAIIGPMGAAASLAAARQAQHEQVPIITLSQVEKVTAAGDYVFQNFFTPDEQVEALLKEFVDRRGIRRRAILSAETEYGRGFAAKFSQGAVAHGAEVVDWVTFQPNLTDFTVPIKKLAHLPPGNYRPGLPDSPKPVINFQALFIPDGPDRVAMLAPNLAYFDVVDLWLLGTNLWHSNKLWDMAGRYMKWAAFPDGFNPDSVDPDTSMFVREFNRAMNRRPNVLDAHGYDAARLLRHFLTQANPPRTRAELRQALTTISGLPGVCGLLSVGPERRVRKDLTVFVRRKGVFIPLGDTVMPQPGEGGQANPSSWSDQQTPPPGVTGPAQTAPAASVVR